jgi:hypothetical protein
VSDDQGSANGNNSPQPDLLADTSQVIEAVDLIAPCADA